MSTNDEKKIPANTMVFTQENGFGITQHDVYDFDVVVSIEFHYLTGCFTEELHVSKVYTVDGRSLRECVGTAD
jgi:hypothetical protein